MRPRHQGLGLLCGPSASPLDAINIRLRPHVLGGSIKRFMSSRLSLFLFFLTSSVVCYLFDCLFTFSRYPNLPWYETGIFSVPRGFFVTAGLFLAALYFLIFGKDK